jgi:hypothetical protein
MLAAVIAFRFFAIFVPIEPHLTVRASKKRNPQLSQNGNNRSDKPGWTRNEATLQKSQSNLLPIDHRLILF